MIRLPKSKSKPKVGKLIQVLPSGNTVTLVSNLPFPMLQKKKKLFVQKGYKKESLKVTYLDKDKK